MKSNKFFDVLVVYTDSMATSASSKDIDTALPFSNNSKISDYNDAYAYFLESCRKIGLEAGFTTSSDIKSNKTFKSYWTFKNKRWLKHNQLCSAPLIFDKFSPVNSIQKNRRLSLFSNNEVVPFNSPFLHALFFDKQKTYDFLSEFAIPTVAIERKDKDSIAHSVRKLQFIIDNHPKKADFSRRIVIKDRFGAGGNNIYRTELSGRKSMILKVLTERKKSAFILQPFTMFKKGQAFSNQSGFVDIRIIYLRGKIIQSFIRTAAIDDFRCNMSKGGNIEYIQEDKIPKEVIKIANKILKVLDNKKSLFTLDFIVSNRGNVYLMEGNCGPGLNWSVSIPTDEKNTKKLIRDIVKEISDRTTLRNLRPLDYGLLSAQNALKGGLIVV